MTSSLKTPPSSSPSTTLPGLTKLTPVRMPGVTAKQRHWKGIRFCLEIPIHGVAIMLGFLLKRFRTPERMEHGLVIVLPGIEGQSFLNHNVVRGLDAAGYCGAIRIFDWTTRLYPLFLVHLRSRMLHRRAIRKLRQQIVDYCRDYPGRPISLIGHSGGAGIVSLTLRELPDDCQVDHVVLLAAALSPGFNLASSLKHVKHRLWSFYSPYDIAFLALGTVVCGTIDGRWTVSGGNCGFHLPDDVTDEDRALYAERLRQVRFQSDMVRSYNLGEHLGWTSSVFVAEWIAPLLNSPPNG